MNVIERIECEIIIQNKCLSIYAARGGENYLIMLGKIEGLKLALEILGVKTEHQIRNAPPPLSPTGLDALRTGFEAARALVKGGGA